MNENYLKMAAEMQLPRFAQKTHGLRMSEMHMTVLRLMEQTDKYTLLGLMDDMLDDLTRNGIRALGPNVTKLSKRDAMLLLKDLRCWFIVTYCHDAVENCDIVCDLRRRALTAETELADVKTDGWTGRVTYDNMVEQIAAFEDSSQRDEARKLIEPMLKRDMVRKFREDIKRKVKEMNPEEPKTVNVSGDYNDIHDNKCVEVKKGGDDGRK